VIGLGAGRGGFVVFGRLDAENRQFPEAAVGLHASADAFLIGGADFIAGKRPATPAPDEPFAIGLAAFGTDFEVFPDGIIRRQGAFLRQLPRFRIHDMMTTVADWRITEQRRPALWT
jgi:hypothetical protein